MAQRLVDDPTCCDGRLLVMLCSLQGRSALLEFSSEPTHMRDSFVNPKM